MKVIIKGPSFKRLCLTSLITIFLTYELAKGILTFDITRILLSLIFLIPFALLLVKWITEYMTLRNVKAAFSRASWEGEIILRNEVTFKKNYALLVNERRGLRTKKRIIVLENWESGAGKRIDVKRWGLVINDGKAALRAPLLYFDNGVNVMIIAPLNVEFERKKIVLEEREGRVEAEVSDFIKVKMKVERRGARGAKFFLKGEIAYEGERGVLETISELIGKPAVEKLEEELKVLEVKDEGEAEKRLDVKEPIAIIFVSEDLPKIFKLRKLVGPLGGNDVEYFAKVVLDIPFAKDKVREVPLAIKA